MTFLEAYKKLDNVCKEMYSGDKGVSAYIDDMEHVPNAGYKIQEWNSVYQKLKHYRYIRNQIVHENYATEDNMCNESDVQWIDNFYRQILETSDPLAQYTKTLSQKRWNQSHALLEPSPILKTKKTSCSWLKVFYFTVSAIAMIALIYFLIQTVK